MKPQRRFAVSHVFPPAFARLRRASVPRGKRECCLRSATAHTSNAQAVQEARGGILLRVALRRSFAALRLDAGNANLDDESRRMIRSAAFHHEVIGLHSFFQAPDWVHSAARFSRRGVRRERGEGVVQ